MNENEVNFQYIKCLDVEFPVLGLNESSAEKSSTYEEKVLEINTSSKGLIMKELPKHLNYAFLEAGIFKPVIILADLIKHKEHKSLEILKKYKGAIA